MLNFTPENVLPLKYPTTDPTLPAKGAKAISATCEWAEDTTFQFNLLNAQQQRDFGPLRSIWIDASENTHPITVAVNGTEQVFTVSPGSANYYAVVNLNSPVVAFTIGAQETTITRVIFLNFVPTIPMAGQLSLSGPVTVTGSVAVTNFPATYDVIQGTSPWVVSGNVSVSNFPATQNVDIVNASIPVTQSGAWSVSVTGTPNINLADVGGSAISLGQKTMAASLPVVLASDQSAIPVSGTVTATAGVVNAANSTTALLAANATFTGTGVSVLGYSNVEIILYSNVASAANGLLIEFSSDNVNWDDSSVFSFTPGTAGPNQGQAFIAGVRGQFMRVSYTNGATIQTTFRLQTVLKTNIIGGDVLSINGTINDNNHGFLTVSQIVGKTTGGGGGYVPVKVNPSGTLTVDASNSTNVATVDNLTAVGGSAITLGQKTSANSLPVVIASDQSNLSIIGSSKRVVSNVVTGTTPVSIITAAATILTGISVTIFGAVLGSIVNLQVKDGGGNVIFAVNLPTIATGPSTVTALLYEFTLLNIPLNNGGVNGTAALLSNLTSGSFLVAISTN